MRLHLLVCAAALACGHGSTGTTSDAGGDGVAADVTPPTLPDDLAVTLSGPATASLSWGPATDNRGVVGYEISRDGVALRVVEGTSATDADLASFRNYCYQVCALDAAGNRSAMAGPRCVYTGDGTKPARPSGLTLSLTGAGTLSLSWSAATDDVGVTGYRLYRDGALLATTPGLAFADEPLAPLTRYCYAVAAVDGAGNESERTSEACATTLWRVETVTCVQQGYYVGSPDLAIDSNGKVHVAYSGWNASLDYASNESGGWVTELVKQGTTEGIASPHIALDSKGKSHIAYYSWVDFLTYTRDLKYATNKDGVWADTTLDSAGDVGSPNSIAIGPDDNVHISYADITNGMLKYARGVAPAWTIGNVDAIYRGDSDNLIGVSPGGEAHVLYGEGSYPYAIKHATLGVVPVITTVQGSSMLGGAALAFDAAGATWVGWSNGTLGYAKLDGTGWTAGWTALSGTPSRLSVDAAGKLHFYGASSYFPAEYPDGVLALLHESDASGTWRQEISIVDLEHNALHVALAPGASGQVHVVYADTAGRCIKYATNR